MGNDGAKGFSENLQKTIVSIAKGYVGKEEIKENKGFKDALFQKEMVSVGWQVGDAWCAYFAELIWIKAFSLETGTFDVAKTKEFMTKVFSANSLRTLKNFEDAGWAIERHPSVGALAIWKRQGGGHIDIVTRVNKTSFDAIGGNLSDKVTEVKRTYPDSDGMNIQGFVPVWSIQWKQFTTST
jgi:hypothetical protein